MNDASKENANGLCQMLSILRATIDASPDGILVTDRQKRVLHFNGRYPRMWGIRPESPEAEEHGDLQYLYLKHLAAPVPAQERVEEIYAAWLPQSYDVLELMDGRVFERFSQTHSNDGQSIGRIWIFRDITARRQAENAVRESDERLCFMAEVVPQKIFTARPDGSLDYVNQQWKDYAGLPPEQMERS